VESENADGPLPVHMKVLFVTPELAPFVKVGGLADVSHSLPRALAGLGHQIGVVLPLYGGIDRVRHGVHRRRDPPIRFVFDGEERQVSVYRSRLGRVTVWLLANDHYFGADAVYTGSDEDAHRFAFFSRAAHLWSERVSPEPDVIHVNDWPTALLPVYQRLDPRANRRPVVLTVHNLAYQGLFPRALLARIGLPDSWFRLDGVEFYGKINYLKGGLITAERLTTVSPTYAREIRSESLGAGLDGLLRARASALAGIRNGIDEFEWDPERDPALRVAFSPARLAGKAKNKMYLQRELGLEEDPRSPLFAAIGRLVPQKGFDLVLEAFDRMRERGLQLVVLGSGDDRSLEPFRDRLPRFSRILSVQRGFQDELGRRIYASADLFLMPSRYEPCGLGQMIALRFGTLPIVRATGGLVDTIRDLDENRESGNGFVFEEASGSALAGAMERAMRHHRDSPELWKRWVRRAMREDFSWGHSAQRYVRVYEDAIRATTE
jgi:starch synthase